VPSPPDVLLTKAAELAARSARDPKRDQAAAHLQRRAVRRLELVAWLTLAAQVLVWLAVNLVQGTLAEEFDNPLEWGFPFGVAAASLGMALLTRHQRLTTAAIVRFGLIYQVVISFGMAGGTYYGAFERVAPGRIEFDTIGLTFVGPWMLLFSVLVPAPPKEALAALLASAAAVPLTYLAQVPSQLAPALPLGRFGLIFVSSVPGGCGDGVHRHPHREPARGRGPPGVRTGELSTRNPARMRWDG
jgi:hypothetical protein